MTAEPTALPLRHALASLYGAVAAALRHDRDAVGLLLGDLLESLPDLTEALTTISIATLERLEAALGSGIAFDEDSGCTARCMLTLATGYHLAGERSVHAAAWRLDAVRNGDRDRASADVASSLALGDGDELARGAVALLTAIVAMWATRTGRSARVAASDLCLAAAAIIAES